MTLHARLPVGSLLVLLPLAASCGPGPGPAGPRPSMAMAIEKIAGDDCEAAEPMLRRLLAEHLADPADLHHYLGVCRQAQGDLPGAEEHYRQALRRNPALFESRNNLGVLLGELGRHEESLAVLAELTQAFPEEPAGFFNLGYEQAAAGDVETAMVSFRRAAELDTCSAEALLQIAALQEAVGNTDEAVAALQEGLRRQPGDGAVAVTLARTLLAAGRRDEAADPLAAAVRAPANDARTLVAVAFAYRDLERLDDALAAARVAAGRADDDEQVRLAALALAVLARQAGRPADAEAALRTGLDRLPAEPGLHLFLGGMLAENGRCPEAVPHLKQALDGFAARDPNAPQVGEARSALTACGEE